MLVVGVNFGGHFGGQNVQVSMLRNRMVTSCVQSAEQIGSKKLAIGKKFERLPATILFEPICSADCTQLVTILFRSILTCTFCPPKWPPKLTPTTNTFVVINVRAATGLLHGIHRGETCQLHGCLRPIQCWTIRPTPRNIETMTSCIMT